jgi:hypothetical protein
LTKFIRNNFILLQRFLYCYGFFENRVVEGHNSSFRSKFYLDLGLNRLLEYDNSLIEFNKKKSLFLFYDLDFFFDEMLFDILLFNKKFVLVWVYYFLKKSYTSYCFLRGRLLNLIKNGYSIGICGIVCFLPKTESQEFYFNRKTKSSIFYIKKLDLLKKICILSQRNIIKQSSRVLFKLSLNSSKNNFLKFNGKHI